MRTGMVLVDAMVSWQSLCGNQTVFCRSYLCISLPIGVSAVGLTLVLNFFGLAISIVKLIAAGAEVNKSAVLHQELQMRYSHSRTVSPNGGEAIRSEAVMSAHDRMFDSAMRTLEICDLREPVTVLGMRASTSLLSPVRAQINQRPYLLRVHL